MIENNVIGEAIKKARLSKHITQEELGKRIGVNKAWISKIEHGTNITIDSMIKIFRALDIPAKLVLNGRITDLT